MIYRKPFILLILVWAAFAVQPTPNCSQGFFYHTLPVAPYEHITYDLDDLFTGYNVDFTLTDASDYDFVTLNKKLVTNAQQTLVDQLVGLKSIHMEEAGNEWGEGFIALTQKGNSTVIQYGLLADNKSAPVVNYRVVVENQSNIKCFDALIFAARDLILVDCMLIRNKVGDDGKIFQNRFVYVKLSRGEVLQGYVDNQLYVNFSKIQRRRLNLYTDHQTGHHFMLRAYFADGVDIPNRHNTYIQVFQISYPLNPWIVKVVDRSLIHKKQFAITDFKIYLGDIYVLDYWQGLYRVDLTNHMQLILLGHYSAEGYTKFSVFSENLDNTFVIALANSHSAIQVDWSVMSKPVLLTKYSLLPNSTIEQLALNLDYLVVQSFTPVTTSKGEQVIYNYTWIFNRADRTFNKAFKVINHHTYKTAIFLNKAKSYLLVVDQDTLTNYAIRRPILSINPKNQQKLQNQLFNFTLVAQSTDPMSNTRATCKLIVNFTLVNENNKTIWPTGKVPPSQYSVNAPGDLYIPIHDYVLGPNVTYQFKAFGQKPPKSYVLQQDQMSIHWEQSPGLIASRFLYADLWRQNGGNDTIILYIQDFANKLYVSSCQARPLDLQIFCKNRFTHEASGAITNWGSGTYSNIMSQQTHHVIAFTLDSHNSSIFIRDLTTEAEQVHLDFPSGYEGYVSTLEITNHYLVVCQQYIKTISIYDLNHCHSNNCRAIYEINSTVMKRLGINYFSPINVQTSIFHPEVIFIQTEHSVIIVDIDKQGHPVLLGVIQSDATKSTESQFKMGINKDFLFITNYPSTIEEYDISDIYKFQITKTKNYPLYGYTLPKDYDLDVSDQGDTIYVSVIDSTEQNRHIFVYRGGYPAVSSLYDTIQLGATREVLIDVTGYGVDYVVTIVGSMVKIFKQLEQPLAVASQVSADTQFALEFYNDKSIDTNLTIVNVKVQNWPMTVKVLDYYKQIMNTKDLLVSGDNIVAEFDDSQWHTGHVINITAECADCQDKIIIKGHIQEERQILGVPGMYDYQWGFDGGSVQQQSHVIHMLHNGSIDQLVNLPQAVFGEKCLRVAVPIIGSYHLSACESTKGVQVYITSFISKKGFSWGPWTTGAVKANRIEVLKQLVMLVDTDTERAMTRREGAIHMYAINVNPDSQQLLQEIDIIDNDDLGGVSGWDSSEKAYFNNADLNWIYETDSYRLIITEQTKGLFIVDFKWILGSPQLTIKNIDFINLPKLLQQNGYHMPYDARFEAIAVLESSYDHDQQLQTQSILITTGRFHTFQIGLITDKNGNVMHLALQRVYLRYAGFHVQNYIRHQNNYFLISQIAPDSEIKKKNDISKQLLSVYHTQGKFNGTIQRRSMRSSFVMNDRNLHLFDFNRTFRDAEFDRAGIVLVDRQAQVIKQLSVYKNITITIKQELPTQIINLYFSNDYSSDVMRIYLRGTSPYPRWKVVLIVVFSIVGALILGAVGLFVFMKIRAKRGQSSQTRQSLISDNQN